MLCQRYSSQQEKGGRLIRINTYLGIFMNEVKPRAATQIQGSRVQNFANFIENETQDGVYYLPEILHKNYNDQTMDC